MPGSIKQLIPLNSKNSFYNKNCLVNLIYNTNYLINPQKPNNYLTPVKDEHLKTDNYLSEYDTKAKQMWARQNLGVDGIAYWGNIQGYLEDLLDLLEYVADSSDDIKYKIKEKDFILNENYAKAINKLGREIKSIDDAISVIMYSLFPIEYRQWNITSSTNITKAYSFENGTTLNIDGEDKIGSISFTATPGNLNDTVSMSVGGYAVNGINEQHTYTKTIKAKDILGDLLSYNSNAKILKIYVGTIKNETTDKLATCLVTITISTYLSYFYFSSPEEIEDTVFHKVDLQPTQENTHTFQLSGSKQYVYVLSPTEPTKIETSAGYNINALPGFSIVTDYNKKQVLYYPTNGSVQNYWLIRLNDPQSNIVKIKIT